MSKKVESLFPEGSRDRDNKISLVEFLIETDEHLRLWQAIQAWGGFVRIETTSSVGGIRDMYYIEGEGARVLGD